MKQSIIAALVLALLSGSAFAGGGREHGRKSSGNQAQGQAQGQAQLQAQGQRQGQSQAAFGGTGGTGGLASSSSSSASSASNGGQSQVFSPVLNWSGGGSGSGLEGKINPDVSPPSMPSVTPCTVGLSAGISVAGFGLGGGGYTDDLLCGWERQHALEIAVNNQEAAREIREGMVMVRCENTPEVQRKYFKACANLARERGEQPANPAFNSK